MKMKLSGLAAVTVALMVGGQALALDVTKLCGEFQLLANPETKVYRGEWKSRGVTLDGALVIAEVTDSGKALVFYVNGKQPQWNIDRAGCSANIATLKGDTLTIKWPRITVTYELGEDGTASAEYVSKRGGIKRKTPGEFTLAE